MYISENTLQTNFLERHLLTQRWVSRCRKPGSGEEGLVFGLAQRGSLPPATTLFLAGGVLGGFTTFSAFSYETMRLLANGSIGASFLNVAGQLAVGLVAVYVGFVAVRGL
jgi:CrcB protein